MVISLVNTCTGGGFRNFATLTNTILYYEKVFILMCSYYCRSSIYGM